MRLLAIRAGGLGDCIVAFPALEALRARCEYLEVWVPAAVVPLVPLADRVRAISSTGLDLLGVTEASPQLIAALRGFDAIVSWYGSNREEFREATRALGLPFEFHAALARDPRQHVIDFLCAQAGGATAVGAVPRVRIGDTVKRDFVAIHPFSGGVRKNWPLAEFDQVAAGLGVPVEWCATPEQAAAAMGPRAPLLAVDDLSVVARWLAEARLYIGNDSGITHLAAAVGTPVVALFSTASDAAIWAPRGAARVEILRDASVAGVLEAVQRI